MSMLCFAFSIIKLNWGCWLCRCLPFFSSLWVFTFFNLDIIISSIALVNLIAFLYKNSRCYFKILYDMFIVDFLNVRFLRFEVIIAVLSLLYNSIIHIHYYLLENNILNTISTYFLNAIFFECEIWDMFGLYFVILKTSVYHIFLDYGFKGYPLRKDFVPFGYLQLKYHNVKNALNVCIQRANYSVNSVIETSLWKVVR